MVYIIADIFNFAAKQSSKNYLARTQTYIYIYIERERERKGGREWEREKEDV